MSQKSLDICLGLIMFGADESDTPGLLKSCLDFFQLPSCSKAASLIS